MMKDTVRADDSIRSYVKIEDAETGGAVPVECKLSCDREWLTIDRPGRNGFVIKVRTDDINLILPWR